jgi:hypothetical protein
MGTIRCHLYALLLSAVVVLFWSFSFLVCCTWSDVVKVSRCARAIGAIAYAEPGLGDPMLIKVSLRSKGEEDTTVISQVRVLSCSKGTTFEGLFDMSK